jgi:hypothetical protein
MSEISITIKGIDGETATLTAPSDLPLSSITASVQSALEKCSTSLIRQRAWAENVAKNIAPNWDLDTLGTWGVVDNTVIFFPNTKVTTNDLEEVNAVTIEERSLVEVADTFKLQAWDEMTDFVKALSLAALIACYEGAMLVVRYPMDFEIGDDKYCPAPGIVRNLWEKMKGYAK